MSMTKGQARKLFEALLADFQQADKHLRIAHTYRALASEFKAEIKKAPEFWGATYWSHIDAATYRLCLVYDTSGFSLEKLLLEIQKNSAIYDAKKLREHYAKLPRPYQRKVREINPQPLLTDIKMVSSENPLVETLRKWRNNRLSHKIPSDIFDPEKLGRDYPLRIMDLEILQEIGLRIANYYGEIVFNLIGQVAGDEEAEMRLVLESVKSSELTMQEILEKRLQRS